MRNRIARSLLPLLLLGAGGVAIAAQQEMPRTLEDLCGLPLPPCLGGLQFRDIIPEGPGRNCAFTAPDLNLSTYVYSDPCLERATPDEALRCELEGVALVIVEAYRPPDGLKISEIRWGERRVFHGIFDLPYPGKVYVSHFYLTLLDDRFLKLRFSYAAGLESGERTLEEILAVIRDLVDEPPPEPEEIEQEREEIRQVAVSTYVARERGRGIS